MAQQSKVFMAKFHFFTDTILQKHKLCFVYNMPDVDYG